MQLTALHRKKNGFSYENNEKKKNTPKFMKTNLFKGNYLSKSITIKMKKKFFNPNSYDNFKP